MPEELILPASCLLWILLIISGVGLFISLYDRTRNYDRPHAWRLQVLDGLILWLCFSAILILVAPEQILFSALCSPVWMVYYMLSFLFDRVWYRFHNRWMSQTFANLFTIGLRANEKKPRQKNPTNEVKP